MEKCYFSPSRKVILDFCDENGKTLILKESLEQVRERAPDAIESTFDAAMLAIEEGLIDPVPEKITQQDFKQAFNLMPCRHVANATTETFMTTERLSGLVTRIYVRIGDAYFALHDRCTLSHDQIVAKIRATCVLEQSHG